MNKLLALVLVLIPLLFMGCVEKIPIPQEPMIITKIVEKDIPIYCNIPDVIKPDYTKGNRAQKLYMSIEYSKKLELALIACKRPIE
jgi:hypothetical protein